MEHALNLTDEGVFSNDGGQVIADRFILTEPAALRSVTWFGRHPGMFAPAPDDAVLRFDYRIHLFKEVGNGPVEMPFRSIEVSIGRLRQASAWFSYSADFDEILLEPGAYWLSLVYLGNNSDWLWGGSIASGPGISYRVGDSGTWKGGSFPNRSGAFTLYGTAGGAAGRRE